MYNFGAFAPFHWANRHKAFILTYHRFSREKEHGKISAGEFESHLEYLKKHNSVLSLSETLRYLGNGKTLPPNTVVITIDDGYADAHEIAFPLLKKFGFPATIYAITDFLDGKIWLWTDLMRDALLNTKFTSIEIPFGPTDTVNADLTDTANRLETAGRINERLKKLPNKEKDSKIKEIANDLRVEIPKLPPAEFAALNWTQASEMDAAHVSIESHTVTHPILTNIGEAELEFEMSSSKNRLEDVLERSVTHFCYPNGSLDTNVRTAAKNAGYVSAVTTAYGFNTALTDPHLMNRIDAQSAIENFAQSVSGFESLRQEIFQ